VSGYDSARKMANHGRKLSKTVNHLKTGDKLIF
jgi:hypothetical protein